MKKIYVSPYFGLLIILLCFTQRYAEYSLIFIIALIHELFHLIAAQILGYRTSKFKIMPYGVCLELETKFISDTDELIVSAAGPFANLFLLVICIILKRVFNIDTLFFAYGNIYMMLLNMVPAFPLDGGRIFECLFKEIFNIFEYHYRILNGIISFFMFFLGLFLLIKTRENFSLILAGLFMVNYTKPVENKPIKIYNIMYKNKLRYNPCVLTLNCNLKIRESLEFIKADRMTIIFILDDSKRIVNVVTSAQILICASNGYYDILLNDIQRLEKNDG